jgi:hypothetical protein
MRCGLDGNFIGAKGSARGRATKNTASSLPDSEKAHCFYARREGKEDLTVVPIEVCCWQILLQKSFWGDGQDFPGPLMRFARGLYEGPHRFAQKRLRSFVSALRSIAAAATAKNQLLRDFRRRSIFDFCNNIGTFETCRPSPSMSVHRGRPEVVGAQVETTHLDRGHLRSYPVSRIVR